MGRILAIDYGGKRTGLAWTDPFQLLATGIGSFATEELETRIKNLIAENDVESILLGYPTRMDGTDTHATPMVREFEQQLKTWFPHLPVERWDERLTSRMAMQAMVEGGVKKKKRRDKHLINEISAVLILQEYLSAKE